MSASTVASLWETFRENPASEDLYLPDTHIVFLPTGAGAASEQYVREFYKTGGYSHPKKLAVEEKVIHRTVGESSAVDEVEVTVKFVSGAGGWLLPGIEPHHLEDLVITFPLVICASIEQDRIASVRYVWDNASVLKMVKLIGSRHSWPIVAETQVDALREPTRFRLNPFGNPTVGSRHQTGISKIFGSPPVSPPQQTSQSKKGHPALTSTVFSHLKNNDTKAPLSPSSSEEAVVNKASTIASPPSSPGSAKKGHPALTSTLFNHLKDQPQTTSNRPSRQELQEQEEQQRLKREQEEERGAGWRPDYVKPKGHPALTSSIFSNALAPAPAQPATRSPATQEQQQVPEEERGAGWRADYVKPKGHPALTSSIFSQQPVASTPTPVRPYKKTSHNIFGPPVEETTKNVPKAHVEQEQQQQQEEEEPKPYQLEPSAIEAELERHEHRQQEIKKLAELNINEIAHAESLAQIEKQIQAQEELNAQEEQKRLELAAKEEAAKKSPVLANAPLSPLSPATTPPQKRVHPNYRSSFTIGGPR
ncbi:hypothetical protein BGZ49_003089 [Haplosporangium sp. Z 27]|nr:hypothetical protein BGZ49_003089 [Haplosporangium sp. Z 27]